MKERSNAEYIDIRQLQLPRAKLSTKETVELVGSLVFCNYHAELNRVVESFCEALAETEQAARNQGYQWGTGDFEKADELSGIYHDLSDRVRPIHELLPTEWFRHFYENDPIAIRLMYYWWLRVWHDNPDSFLHEAAILHGCYQAAFVGLAHRILRNMETYCLEHDGHKGALAFLTEEGLGGPASLAFLSSPGPIPTQKHARNTLLRAVKGVAKNLRLSGQAGGGRKRGVPIEWESDTSSRDDYRVLEDQKEMAAMALVKALRKDHRLNTETRRIVQTAGGKYMDQIRKVLLQKRRYPSLIDEMSYQRKGFDPHVVERGSGELPSHDDVRDEKADRAPDDPLKAELLREAMDRIVMKKFRGTPRKVYQLLVQGKKQVEIATILGREESTISEHVTNIKRALKMFDPP